MSRSSLALSAALLVGVGVLAPASPVRAAAPPPRPGYVVVSADGGVFVFGTDRFAGSLAGRHLQAPIVAVLPNADAVRNGDGTVQPSGYLLVDAAGHVYPFGNTHSLGDLSHLHLRAPIVDAAGDSRGYVLVGADGGAFTFGQVRFHGSLGGKQLAAPIVGVALSGDKKGYWLVDQQARAFGFGDASVPIYFPPAFPVGTPPTNVVGIAGDGRNDGYWIATSDGQIIAVGSAHSRGDLHHKYLAAPIVRIATSDDGGYYLLGADGGVFTFGTSFLGSMSGHRLAEPATGMYSRYIPNRCFGTGC